MSQPDYGNWIRRRILIKFLAIATMFGVLALLPLPPILRIASLLPSVLFFSLFLYLTYIYFQFSARGGNLQYKLHRLILDHINISDHTLNGKTTALDIGTGNGALAIEVAQTFPTIHAVGIDLWAEDWEYSKAVCDDNARVLNLADRVTFQQGSAACLPFADDAFDLVVSHFVFHEVQGSDKREVVKEALRVLAKGGSFAFQDMFLNTDLYGEIPTMIESLRQAGITSVEFILCDKLLNIPPLLRHHRVLGYAGLLFGRK
jgi:SAM-dependent methyltransferase